MAFSQKLSLRAYSFSFKKWKGKNPEQILPLNAKVIFNRLQDGEERTYEYTSALDLIVDFIGANTDVDDKEVRQQLFNCSFDSTNQGETDTYRYLIFTVYAGYYGYASKLVNRKTKSTVHKKSRDEADVKPFYVVVVIPKDTEISKAQRGLILFQEIGKEVSARCSERTQPMPRMLSTPSHVYRFQCYYMFALISQSCRQVLLERVRLSHVRPANHFSER